MGKEQLSEELQRIITNYPEQFSGTVVSSNDAVAESETERIEQKALHLTEF